MLQLLHVLKLQAFKVGTVDAELQSSEAASSAVAALIEAQEQLAHLEVTDFFQRFRAPFMAASHLPCLVSASFSTLSFVSPITTALSFIIQTRSPTAGFLSLEDLESDIAASQVPRLLSLVGSAGLQTLRLRFEQPGVSLSEPLNGVGRFKALTTVRLWFDSMQGRWEDFRPLLLCTKLRSVTLEGERASKIFGDAELCAMAQAWSGLREIQIKDTFRKDVGDPDIDNEDRTYPPTATLAGITTFAAHCPFLTTLILSIDARHNSFHPTSIETARSVQTLWFPNSLEGGRHFRIARFIAEQWPYHQYPQPSFYIPVMKADDPWRRIWTLAQDYRARRE